MIPENEQWKLDGICSKCRRQSYCSGNCKKHERHRAALFSTYVANACMNVLFNKDKNKGE